MDIELLPESIYQDYRNDRFHFKVQQGTSRDLGPSHIHDYFQIWYVLCGSFHHVVNYQSFQQNAGDLLIVPPYIPHKIDTSQASSNLQFIFCDLAENFLNLFPEGMEKSNLFYLTYLRPLAYNATTVSPFLSFSGNGAERVEALYSKLLSEYKKNTPLSPAYIRADLIQLLSLVAEHYHAATSHKGDALYAQYRAALQETLDYIEAHYTESISLNDICNIALMSPSSFSYVFKQLTGKTLIAYIHSLRIRLAMKLLETTSLSISDISWKCGYTDTTYFGKVFKRHTGMLPKKYQLMHHKNSSI